MRGFSGNDDDLPALPPPGPPPRRRLTQPQGAPPAHDYRQYESTPLPVMQLPQAPAAIEPTKTKLAMDLKLAFVIAMGLLTGGAAAGVGYREMTFKVAALESRLGDVATKADLANMRSDITRDLRAKIHEALVDCPAAVRKGATRVECRIVLQGGH